MYTNKWINEDGKIVKSENRPAGNFYAMYALSRVRGYSYVPYTQGTEWAEAANRRMADQARYNFEKQSQR